MLAMVVVRRTDLAFIGEAAAGSIARCYTTGPCGGCVRLQRHVDSADVAFKQMGSVTACTMRLRLAAQCPRRDTERIGCSYRWDCWDNFPACTVSSRCRRSSLHPLRAWL